MLKIILWVVVLAIAALLLYAASRPDNFRIERAARIRASADKVFALINDLHGFNTWSPYIKLDPAMKQTYSGTANGVGAVYEWQGNKNVGAGRMEIIQAEAPHKVVMKLEFLQPFAASNTAEFSIQPQGEFTQVTWALYGPSPFMSKLMGIFMNMDRMVGDQFTEGLANLKQRVQA